jgi:diketogulonate reductase-like aldo/keto reductase
MDLLSYCRIKPVVNQVELHPYLTQDELVEYCNLANIHLTAFSPLGSSSYIELGMDGGRGSGVLNEPVVREIAAALNRTPAQVS